MKADQSRDLYYRFLKLLESGYQVSKIKNGIFGSYMELELVNDGPVTIILDSKSP
jgi:D-aminoacyl-tRNA deacylase